MTDQPAILTPAQFIDKMILPAQSAQKQSGISAGALIAQAALESGWGVSKLSQPPANNLFGIKATSGWNGETVIYPTKEFIQGKWLMVQAKWRAYPDWAASIANHAKFLYRNPRYKPALSVRADAEAFCQQLQACGYATDPQYSDLLISIVRGRDLTQYDVPETEWELAAWARI